VALVVDDSGEHQRVDRGRQAQLGLEEQREGAQRRAVGALGVRSGLRGDEELAGGEQPAAPLERSDLATARVVDIDECRGRDELLVRLPLFNIRGR
jgi:hypothetical protein